MSSNHHIVSIVSWLDCFTTHATELVKLSIYKGILDNSRNWQFRKWTAQNMKGTLICTNPICENSKTNIGKKKKKLSRFTSNQCKTDIEYRYNPDTKQGEIKIAKMYTNGRECNKCNKVNTLFELDGESIDKAMLKIVDRIKNIYYIDPRNVLKVSNYT